MASNISCHWWRRGVPSAETIQSNRPLSTVSPHELHTWLAANWDPALTLRDWWSRLTARGATAGVVCGAVLATGAIFAGLASGSQLLVQPAVLTVPAAFAVMIGGSLVDRRRGADSVMLALHAPEGLVR